MKIKNKILIFIGIILLLFIIIFMIYGINIKITEKNEYDKYLKEKYDRINKELTYKTPNEFQTKDKLYYSYYNKDIDCKFEFDNMEKNNYYKKTLEDFLRENIYVSLDYNTSEVIKDETKNINYLLITVEKNNNKTYYYAFESKNYYYIFEYSIYDYKNGDRKDIDTNICYTAKDKILNSIKIKK